MCHVDGGEENADESGDLAETRILESHDVDGGEDNADETVKDGSEKRHSINADESGDLAETRVLESHESPGRETEN